MKPNGRTAKAIAILCVALVVFAGVVPAASALLPAILTPLWLIIPAVIVTVVRRRAAHREPQPVSLLSAGLFRAPPLALA